MTTYSLPKPNPTPDRLRSPSLSPGVLASHEKALTPAGGAALRALRAAQKAIGRMADARDRMDAFKAETRSNPAMSEHAKVARIADESRRMAAEVDAAVQSQLTTLAAVRIELDGKIANAIHNFDYEEPTGAVLAQEIRSHLARMSDSGDRLKFFNDALAKADHRTLSAILMAPAYLSGFDDDAFARLRSQAAQALGPDVASQLEELDKIEAKIGWAAHAFAEEHAREAKTPNALAMLDKFAGQLPSLRDQNRVKVA